YYTVARLDEIKPQDVIKPRKIELKTAKNTVRAWLFMAKSKTAPVLIWLHGQSDSFSPRWHKYAQYFAHAGVHFVALNFSGSPGSELAHISRNKLKSQQELEIIKLISTLKNQPQIKAQKVFLLGVSAGSELLERAARRFPNHFDGLIEYSPAWGKAFSTPIKNLPPLLVFMGKNDSHLNINRKLHELESQKRNGNLASYHLFSNEGHDLRHLNNIEERLKKSVEFIRQISQGSYGLLNQTE
ncbi:MAG: hypothetical protein D6719_04695, partial [Candidatus Dadabacteria bacterium]